MMQQYIIRRKGHISYDTLVSLTSHPIPVAVAETLVQQEQVFTYPDPHVPGLIQGAEMYREVDSLWLDGRWSEIHVPVVPIRAFDTVKAHAPLVPASYAHIEIKPKSTSVEGKFPWNPQFQGASLTLTILATAIFIFKIAKKYEHFRAENRCFGSSAGHSRQLPHA
jgi:hypothetical protein